jgi:hypothetical protein
MAGPSSAKTPICEITSLAGWIFPPRAQAATHSRKLLVRSDDHRALDDLVSQVHHQRVRGNAAFALKPAMWEFGYASAAAVHADCVGRL